jgi:hypothetical protein
MKLFFINLLIDLKMLDNQNDKKHKIEKNGRISKLKSNQNSGNTGLYLCPQQPGGQTGWEVAACRA